MVKSRYRYPKEGEFVVARVVEVQQQYIYVDLLDYEGHPSEEFARGMIHISEISSRWIKNIRTFANVGQRSVLKVLRVDSDKGHVDCSLRRVNSAQKENRMKEWKYGKKYESLMEFLSEENDITFNEAYRKIGFPVLDLFGSYQETLEGLKENGEEILKTLKDVPEDILNAYLIIIEQNVKISTVNIIAKIKLSFTSSNGIDIIKETLGNVKKVIEKPKETRKIVLIYIGTPYYRLEITSKDYIDAESILSDIVNVIEEKVAQYKGQFELIRD